MGEKSETLGNRAKRLTEKKDTMIYYSRDKNTINDHTTYNG